MEIPGFVFLTYLLINISTNFYKELMLMKDSTTITLTNNITLFSQQIQETISEIYLKIYHFILIVGLFVFLYVIIFSIIKNFSILFIQKHKKRKPKNKKYLHHIFLIDFGIGLLFSVLLTILLMISTKLFLEGEVISPYFFIILLLLGLLMNLFSEFLSFETHQNHLKIAIKKTLRKFKKNWKSMILSYLEIIFMSLLKWILIIFILISFKIHLLVLFIIVIFLSFVFPLWLVWFRIRNSLKH